MTTIALCGEDQSPLAKEATYSVTYGMLSRMIYALCLLLERLCTIKGNFDSYPRFADELKNLGNVFISVGRAADDYGKKYAELFNEKDKEYQIWCGSGMTWGMTYSMAMCGA